MEDSLVAKARDLPAREVRFVRGDVTGVIVVADGRPQSPSRDRGVVSPGGASPHPDPGQPADDRGVVSPYPTGDADRRAPWLWRAAAVFVVGGGVLLSRARSSAVPALSAVTVAVGVTVYSVGLPDTRPEPAPSVAAPRAPGRSEAFAVREAGGALSATEDGGGAGQAAPPPVRAARHPVPPPAGPGATIGRIQAGDQKAGADLGGLSTGDDDPDVITEYVSDCVNGERRLDPGQVHVDPNGPSFVKPPALYCDEA